MSRGQHFVLIPNYISLNSIKTQRSESQPIAHLNLGYHASMS